MKRKRENRKFVEKCKCLAESSDILPQTFSSSSPFFVFNMNTPQSVGTEQQKRFPRRWVTVSLVSSFDKRALPVLADLPRTCFSRLSMTCTACCRMISLVWALSLCRWTWHILPSSLKASFMSRTRTLSLALLARRRSRSLCSFSSAVRFSSVTETRLQSGGEVGLSNPNQDSH